MQFPQDPKPRSHHHLSHRFSKSNSLDFSTWISDNIYRVILLSILFATVAAVLLLRHVIVEPTALLCAQSQPSNLDKYKLKLHKINYKVENIVDVTTPFSSFRSENWIVVSVSDYPTDAVRSLARIKNWQMIAVGNTKTPPDWALKGAIFLSVDQQAQLGFRILEYLPYDSYVRKTVGYLFAIQHGAKKIFDADDRGEVIDNDIGKHFDVELVGESARQEIILQYSHEKPNRTIVNPFIHFGQKSVWPRGLPLENVGEIRHEEFFTEIYGSKQYIQQGISNGLPDIDSVFYFTRKPYLEAFDIRFDDQAPKVALPQGTMVPVNSFNTIYHSPAFWGLMLPVSVSTMASDILRGYWAQRILWEVGGYVVVYPPTMHRYDKVEGYPFSEEKDLHTNVGRLIKFLISWRAKKHDLFDKILELSYAMVEEGFWTERDLQFTEAWLMDLLAVNYQQPRLMSIELDGPRATIGHGEKKKFIPRKLPSVHLGVEEIGTVNNEIGNLIRWRKNFGNVVLVMYCNGPVERTALEWRLLYGRIFKTVVILAEQKNVDLAVEEGHSDYLYKDLPTIFKRFTSAEGFLFLQDYMVLNYWNLLQADRNKLWITDKVFKSWTIVKPEGKENWFTKQAETVKKIGNSMPVHFQVSYKETITSENILTVCNSEIFYIPRRLISDFIDLINLVGDEELHHKVAIPMLFMAMDSTQNFDPVFNNMIYETEIPSNSSSFYSAQVPAIRPWRISSEQEFLKLIRIMATGDPLLIELV